LFLEVLRVLDEPIDVTVVGFVNREGGTGPVAADPDNLESNLRSGDSIRSVAL